MKVPKILVNSIKKEKKQKNKHENNRIHRPTATPQIITLENKKPTKSEKGLYLRAGYYVIDKSYIKRDGKKEISYLKYAVCYTEKDLRDDIPKKFPINTNAIDYDSTIEFFSDSENIKINGLIDVEILKLIKKRTKELGWNTDSRRNFNLK